MLANGLSGDIVKTEEEESEDLRIESEKETQIMNELNSLFDSLFEDEDEKEQQDKKEDKDDLNKEAELKIMNVTMKMNLTKNSSSK